MNINKISTKEIFIFAFILSVFMFPGFGNTFILEAGRNSSVITSIIGFLLGYIPLFLILSISKQTDKKNIFELNIERFKILGHILNILLALSIIYMIITSMWASVNFIVSQFLTKTSYYLVLLSMCLIGSITITKGIEVIGRTSIVLFIFFVGTIIFSWLFSLPNFDTNNLFPIIDINSKNFIKSTLMYTSLSSLPLITLLFLRKNDIVDKEKFNKRIILGYTIAAFVLIIFFLLIILTFGIDLSILFGYPEYALFKKINAFNFIQRIENIISITIFITSFISFSLLNTFLTEYIKTTFKVKEKKKTNIISILLVFIIPYISTYLFINKKILFIYTKYTYYSLAIFIVLIINWILLLITKKKK